jgi:hypothetical protein
MLFIVGVNDVQVPTGLASQAKPVVSDDFATMLQVGKGIVLSTIVCKCA